MDRVQALRVRGHGFDSRPVHNFEQSLAIGGGALTSRPEDKLMIL